VSDLSPFNTILEEERKRQESLGGPSTERALEASTRISQGFGRYDESVDPAGARYRLQTDYRAPITPGAPAWQWVPEDLAERFQEAIRGSSNPDEMADRLTGAYYLSRLSDIPFDDAFRDQDRYMREWRNEVLKPKTWAEAVRATWQAAWIGNEIATLGNRLWLEAAEGKDVSQSPAYQRMLELRDQMPPQGEMLNKFPSNVIKWGIQFIPSRVESMGGAALGGAMGGLGSAAMAGAAGLAGTTMTGAGLASTLGAVAGAGLGVYVLPLIVTAGFAFGASVGAGLKSLDLERGSAYADLLLYRDPNTGASINPQAAFLMSGIYGGLAAVSESIEMGAFFKAFPMLGGAARKALAKAAKDTIEDRAAGAARSGALLRFATRVLGEFSEQAGGRLANIGQETLQEVVQEAMQIGADQIARDITMRVDGTVLTPIQREEVSRRLTETLIGSALGVAAFHVLPATMNLIATAGMEGMPIARTAKTISQEETGIPGLAIEVKPEEMEVFRKRAQEAAPEGLTLKAVERLEGEEYSLRAAVGKDEVGSIRYSVEVAEAPKEGEAPGTVTIQGMKKGTAPNVAAAMVRSLAYRFPGWNIEWEAKSPTQAALKQYLIETNPRGAEAGLQGFALPREIPGQVTVAYFKERLQDVAPGWKDEERDFASRVLTAWARKWGIGADKLADIALAPEVFGNFMKNADVAQGAAGGAVGVRIGQALKSLIQLAPRANPSTALHEITHAVVIGARGVAQGGDQQAQAFLLDLQSAMGMEGDQWDEEFTGWTDDPTVPQTPTGRSNMEALTYALEDYLNTGKAPKPGLEPLFKKLAAYIRDIYEALKGARVKLTPEMTAYFDDLFGGEGSPFLEEGQTEEGIRAQETEAAAAPGLAKQMTQPPVAPDEIMYFQKGPSAERQKALDALETAKEMEAAGQESATIERQTGWKRSGESWTKVGTPEGVLGAPRAVQEERQAGEMTEMAGAVMSQEKNYPDREPMEAILYQGQLEYRYKSEDILQAKMRQAMPGDQVLNLLRGAGVGAEELKWTGLEDFLKGKKKVTPQEVSEYIRTNKVLVEEVVKGDAAGTYGKVWKIAYPYDTGGWITSLGPGYTTREEAETTMAELYPGRGFRVFEVEAGQRGTPRIAINPTKFDNYTLPGGENYTELLFTLPVKDNAAEQRRAEILATREEGGRAYQSAATAAFHTSHWSEPNVLAHTRFDEHTDEQGRRVLFVEEIQSDWHQKGQKEGYEEKYYYVLNQKSGYPDAQIFKTKEAAEAHIKDFPASIQHNLMVIKKIHNGVPDAPLKGESWWQFVFRRMLLEAAKKGAEVLGWTTGEQQAERYDLSKQIRRLLYKKNKDGTFRVSAQHHGRGILLGDAITEDKLEDFVGKDVARRIVEGVGEEENLGGPGTTTQPKDIWKALSGLDLAVGGEGMRNFYDRDLVSYANRFAKKWGAKVEKTKVGGEDWYLWEGDSVRAGPFTTRTEAAEANESLYAGYAEIAQKAKNKRVEGGGDDLIVHALPITDAMKKGLEEGITFFQAADMTKRDDAIDTVLRGLEERGLQYQVTRSRQSGSIYITFAKGREPFSVRLSDHPQQRAAKAVHGVPDFEINYAKGLDAEGLKRFLDSPEHPRTYYQGGAHSLDRADLASPATYYHLTGLYHGSTVGFDRYSHAFMGSGEGHQAYGWGTYLTENHGVAKENYAERLGDAPEFNVTWTDEGIFRGINENLSKKAWELVEAELKMAITEAGTAFSLAPEGLGERLKPIFRQAYDSAHRLALYADARDGTKLADALETWWKDVEKNVDWTKDTQIAGGRWLYTTDVETKGARPAPVIKPAGARWNKKITKTMMKELEKVADVWVEAKWGWDDFEAQYQAGDISDFQDTVVSLGMTPADWMAGFIYQIPDVIGELIEKNSGEALYNYLTKQLFDGNEESTKKVLYTAGITDLYPGETVEDVTLTSQMLASGECDLFCSTGELDPATLCDTANSIMGLKDDEEIAEGTPDESDYSIVIKTLKRMITAEDFAFNRKAIDDWNDNAGMWDIDTMPADSKKEAERLKKLIASSLKKIKAKAPPALANACDGVGLYIDGPDENGLPFFVSNSKTPKEEDTTSGRWLRWDKPLRQADIETPLALARELEGLIPSNDAMVAAFEKRIHEIWGNYADDPELAEQLEEKIETIAGGIYQFEQWKENTGMIPTGADYYNFFAEGLGSAKAASLFLHAAGFDGNKYPVSFLSGGRGDSGFNYVVFSDAMMNISNRVFFQAEGWHGGPVTFDRFSAEYISTGEGALAFGWGLYFTSEEAIARHYAHKLGFNEDPPRFNALTQEQQDKIPGWMLGRIGNARGQAAKKLETERLIHDFRNRVKEEEEKLRAGTDSQPWLIQDRITSITEVYLILEGLLQSGDFTQAERKPSRNLYRVIINRDKPDVWLDWEVPIGDQSPEVREALGRLGYWIPSDKEYDDAVSEARNVLLNEAIERAEERGEGPMYPLVTVEYNADDKTWDYKLDGEYDGYAKSEKAAQNKGERAAEAAYQRARKDFAIDLSNQFGEDYDVEVLRGILKEKAGKDKEMIFPDRNGESIYTQLFHREGGSGDPWYSSDSAARDASMDLLDVGFTGIRYPAASLGTGSRSKGTNYVVFDDSLIEIEEAILYQAGRPMREAVPTSRRRLFQGNGGDEPGIEILKAEARAAADRGEGWEEFMAFCEAMFSDEERARWKMPKDLAPDQIRAWYRGIYEEALEPPDQKEEITTWLKRLQENDHAGLLAFIKKIWTEVLVAENRDVPPGADEEEQREWMEQRARAGTLKGQIAEPIIAAAARLGGRKLEYLSPAMRGSIMGIIRANPEEYAAIYGELTGDTRIQGIGQKASAEKYADIEIPAKAKAMSISQRAALAEQVRDEKLARQIRTGEVVVGEETKDYIKRLAAAKKESEKTVARLEVEAREAQIDMDTQTRALADSRTKYTANKREITWILERIRRFVDSGEEIPAALESRRKKLEGERAVIQRKMKDAGDWVAIEEQLEKAKRDEVRTDAAMQKMNAEGKSAGPKMLAKRSDLQALIRELAAKLGKAKDYRDTASLQTYLSRMEAIQKERRKTQTAQGERRALQQLRRYKERLVRTIMAPAGPTINVAYAKQIRAIQRTIDPETPNAATREQIDALRADLEKNPALAREVSKKWLARALGRNLGEMTLAELEETAKRIGELRDQGRAVQAQIERDRAEDIMDAQIRIAESVMAVKTYHEPTGWEPTKDWLTKMRSRMREIDYAFLSMIRFATMMDGGKEGYNVEQLVTERDRHYRTEMENTARRVKRILDAFTAAGVDPEEWFNTRVAIPGCGPGRVDKTLRKSDLMALELALRNEDSRQAAILGDFFSDKERKSMDDEDLLFEAAERFKPIRAAIDASMTDVDQKILESFAADAAETAPRLSETVARAENREMAEVEDYFPIIKEQSSGQPLDVQIVGEMIERTKGNRKPPRNGFTMSRITVSPKGQRPIKLDLLTTWLESIARQEHYMATVEYGKRLDAYYLAPYVQEQVRAAFGDEGVDYVKEYIAEVKNPGEFRNRDRWENSIRYLRGNLGAAYLAFKSSSVLKQIITSPWPALPYVGPQLFVQAMKCLKNPIQYLQTAEELSIYLKNRSADIFLDLLKKAKADTRLGKALLTFQKSGMKGLELADRFSVAIGWMAMYELKLAETNGDETAAIEAADLMVQKTQPSSRGVDLAPIYRRGGEPARMFLQFTQALNVIWQNIRFDVPNALKTGQYKLAVGTLISYGIAGILLQAATQGAPDEDPEKRARRLLFWSLTQGTDSVPLIGQDATRLLKSVLLGEKSAPMGETLFPGIAEVIEGMYRLSQGDIDKAAGRFARGAGMIFGMPVSGIKEIGRVIQGNPGALAGRPDKE
jgi:hypothetical protein